MSSPSCLMTVTVEAPDGRVLTCGVLCDVTPLRARMATDSPLSTGQTLRFRVFHAHPPDICEHLGRILWTEDIRDPVQGHTARCEVEWLNVCDRGGAGGPRPLCSHCRSHR